MESKIIEKLLKEFESIAYQTESGIEFWLARDLQKVLGYKRWSNFVGVINKAKKSLKTFGIEVNDHIAEASKKVELGSQAHRNIDDFLLTRYGCYLVAQNGDASKPQIAFAQSYFAVQTRKAEIIEKKLVDIERLHARKKLTKTEKELSEIIFEQTHDKNFGMIRSRGDEALFSMPTKEMKKRWKVNTNKPLADHMPTLLLKAKDFATEITIHNAKHHKMTSGEQISQEHFTNNATVRKTLIERGITPEELPPETDIKKVERKLKSEKKKLGKDEPGLHDEVN